MSESPVRSVKLQTTLFIALVLAEHGRPTAYIRQLARQQLHWLPPCCHRPLLLKSQGFTLAELLIALAILGVIATFTIPKILTSQSNKQNNAIVKETAGILSTAFQNYLNQGLLTSTSTSDNIVANSLNYISIDSSSTINGLPNSPNLVCGQNGITCYRIHSGAVIATTGCSFSTTAQQGVVTLYVDPSGKLDNSSSIMFILHANGKLETAATMDQTSVSSASCGIPWANDPSLDPSYFSWN